ncbi:hypothetical protein Ancab_037447 [Ancistrocladus abbreviatus]
MGATNSIVYIQVDGESFPVQVVEEGYMVNDHEVLRSFNEFHISLSESRSYVEDSLLVKNTSENLALVALADDRDQTEKKEEDGDMVAKLSIILRKWAGEPGTEDNKGFSQGKFEIGDSCIKCGINGEENESSPVMAVSDFGSVQELSGESVGPASVDCGFGFVGPTMDLPEAQKWKAGMVLVGQLDGLAASKKETQKVQIERVVCDTEDISSSPKSPRIR